MVDIHSHILPNIDDGARTIEETISMIKEAYQAGFTSIFATSHYMEGSSYNSNKKQKEELIEKIKEELIEHRIPVQILMGTEIYICYDIVKLLQEEILTPLGDSKYVLFELPLNAQKPNYVEELIFELQSNGYVPILAHPERYSYIQEDPNLLVDWIDRGTLIQSNLGSSIGMYGKKTQKTFKKIAEHRMVHFLGTDAHRTKSIYTNMEVAKKQITKLIDKSYFNKLVQNNPDKIIKGEPIVIEDPIRIKKTILGF